jgi:hypothetical protein
LSFAIILCACDFNYIRRCDSQPICDTYRACFSWAAQNFREAQTVNLGDSNFEDGFAARGWFFQEFASGYSAGELKLGKGILAAQGKIHQSL